MCPWMTRNRYLQHHTTLHRLCDHPLHFTLSSTFGQYSALVQGTRVVAHLLAGAAFGELALMQVGICDPQKI